MRRSPNGDSSNTPAASFEAAFLIGTAEGRCVVLFSVKAAAAHACVCQSIIRQWIAAGTLPHFRLGAPGSRGKIVIAVEDLDQFLAAFKVTKKEPEPIKALAPRPVFKHLNLT